MATQNLKTHSGNRLLIEMDGQTVGLLQSVRASDSYGLEDASGIGDIHVQEHVPTKAVHALSVSAMALFTGNLRQRGLMPENGDAALQGMVFDVVCYSRDTGKRLFKYISCSYDSGDVDVSAHRITMQSGQLKALDRLGAEL